MADSYSDTYTDPYGGLLHPFITPITTEALGNDALSRYFKRNVSMTLMLVDGEWLVTQYPTQDQINAASVVYRGGYQHFVSDDEYAALIAAGFVETGADTFFDMYVDSY